MTYMTLLILTLAVYTVVDVWRNSSLFAGWRATVESWQDYWDAAPWYIDTPPGRFFVGALNCTYCVSFHAAWVCLLGWYSGQLGQFVITALAVERCVWLLHGLLPTNLKLEKPLPPAPVMPQAVFDPMTSKDSTVEYDKRSPSFTDRPRRRDGDIYQYPDAGTWAAQQIRPGTPAVHAGNEPVSDKIDVEPANRPTGSGHTDL